MGFSHHTARRNLYALLAAGLLVLSSAGLGVARAQPSASGHVTLCIGSLVVLVAVDAEGRPLDTAHVCPDCLPLALPGSVSRKPAPVLQRATAVAVPRTAPVHGLAAPPPLARGPPCLV